MGSSEAAQAYALMADTSRFSALKRRDETLGVALTRWRPQWLQAHRRRENFLSPRLVAASEDEGETTKEQLPAVVDVAADALVAKKLGEVEFEARFQAAVHGSGRARERDAGWTGKGRGEALMGVVRLGATFRRRKYAYTHLSKHC